MIIVLTEEDIKKAIIDYVHNSNLRPINLDPGEMPKYDICIRDGDGQIIFSDMTIEVALDNEKPTLRC